MGARRTIEITVDGQKLLARDAGCWFDLPCQLAIRLLDRLPSDVQRSRRGDDLCHGGEYCMLVVVCVLYWPVLKAGVPVVVSDISINFPATHEASSAASRSDQGRTPVH